jgi:hypothetical protein
MRITTAIRIQPVFKFLKDGLDSAGVTIPEPKAEKRQC